LSQSNRRGKAVNQPLKSCVIQYHTESFNELPAYALIRQKDLQQLRVIPFSAPTLWRMVAAGTFPKPIKISAQITAWRVCEVRDWLDDPAGWRCPS
jgi:predicted DNA-binding transcriptional regulator AlpA